MELCKVCGTQINVNGVCPKCIKQETVVSSNATLNMYALRSLVLSCVGGLISVLPVGLGVRFVGVLLCVAAIYLGRAESKQIKVRGEKGNVLAVLGVTLGAICTGSYLLRLVVSLLGLFLISSVR